MRGLKPRWPRRPWGDPHRRQPRYPQTISEDRRFCDPASRRVCPYQRSIDWSWFTNASRTNAFHVACAVPPFPGSSQTCMARVHLRHSRHNGKLVSVAIRRQFFSVTPGHNDVRVDRAGIELKPVQGCAGETCPTLLGLKPAFGSPAPPACSPGAPKSVCRRATSDDKVPNTINGRQPAMVANWLHCNRRPALPLDELLVQANGCLRLPCLRQSRSTVSVDSFM